MNDEALLEELGKVLPTNEFPEFLLATQNHSRRAIRLRDDRSHHDLPFETDSVPWSMSGRFLIDSTIRPASFLNYPAGDYYIQDAGSLLPIGLLQPKPGEWICDLCAAPGGKASAILECMKGEGVLVANEPIRSRTNSLRYLLSRTGQPNYVIVEKDPTELARSCAGMFDAVLVDAPCSGQMMVARDKRDANAWSPKQVEHSAKRQNRILDAAIQLLRPGGRLVYSTCTFAVEENENQLQRLQDSYPSTVEPFRFESLKQWESNLTNGCYRLWPHRDQCSGGFAGGLMVKDGVIDHLEPSFEPKRTGPKRDNQRQHHSKAKKIDWPDELSRVGITNGLEFREFGSQFRMGTSSVWDIVDRFPEFMEPPLALIEDVRRIEPSLAMAHLRRTWLQPRNQCSLSKEEALGFVNGEAIRNGSLQQNGDWGVMEWDNRPLGWARYSQGVWKNHLPAWARTRCVS